MEHIIQIDDFGITMYYQEAKDGGLLLVSNPDHAKVFTKASEALAFSKELREKNHLTTKSIKKPK
jgi:hypothetical protein